MGSGPGGHPGVVVVPLTLDTDQISKAIDAALAGGHKFLLQYEVTGQSFAVFASNYPNSNQ